MLHKHQDHHHLHAETTVGAENLQQRMRTTFMVCYTTTTLHQNPTTQSWLASGTCHGRFLCKKHQEKLTVHGSAHEPLLLTQFHGAL